MKRICLFAFCCVAAHAATISQATCTLSTWVSGYGASAVYTNIAQDTGSSCMLQYDYAAQSGSMNHVDVYAFGNDLGGTAGNHYAVYDVVNGSSSTPAIRATAILDLTPDASGGLTLHLEAGTDPNQWFNNGTTTMPVDDSTVPEPATLAIVAPGLLIGSLVAIRSRNRHTPAN